MHRLVDRTNSDKEETLAFHELWNSKKRYENRT